MKREITSARIRVRSATVTNRPVSSAQELNSRNIVERLRDRISDVRSTGITVRTEWLDGQQASWCDLRNVRTIILDASQPASEQLAQLDEIVAEIARLPQSLSSSGAPARNRAA